MTEHYFQMKKTVYSFARGNLKLEIIRSSKMLNFYKNFIRGSTRTLIYVSHTAISCQPMKVQERFRLFLFPDSIKKLEYDRQHFQLSTLNLVLPLELNSIRVFFYNENTHEHCETTVPEVIDRQKYRTDDYFVTTHSILGFGLTFQTRK